MTTATTQSTGISSASTEMLPVDPFRSLYVHFGMLLGVDDFQTLDAYHRGKMWYHSAWLHGKGVIWGLDVKLPGISRDEESEVPDYNGEVMVDAGLALDGLGRELLLEQSACLNLAAWYQANQDETRLQQIVEIDDETGDIIFDGHITIEFNGCLARQVPAMSETCDTSAVSTAYSRVVETVKVNMHPGLADVPESNDYYRLRLLFGFVEPRTDDEGVIIDTDAEVLEARNEIISASGIAQAQLYKQWFDHFAILDGIDLKPETAIGTSNFAGFPELSEGQILLANLTGLRLSKQEDSWRLISGEVDKFVRPFLLPTDIIQSLTGITSIQREATLPEDATPTPVNDAGGPRIDPESVQMQGTENIVFTAVGPPLMKASVSEDGIFVSAFDTRDGWVNCKIKKVHFSADENKVRVELRDAPAGTLVRLIAKGTGVAPLLGRNRIPLAGGPDSPSGSQFDGNDFVYMFRARS